MATIHLDTSLLVDALSDEESASHLLRTLDSGIRITFSTMVLYEWLRGPRTKSEIVAQATLFPDKAIVPFDAPDAVLSANLYRSLKRPRARQADISIAAVAIRRQAFLWTLNPVDFADIPGLSLWNPTAQGSGR